MLVSWYFFSNRLVLVILHNWRASLKKFCRLKILLIQFFPVALSVIFLLVYAKCNFDSVFIKLLFCRVLASVCEAQLRLCFKKYNYKRVDKFTELCDIYFNMKLESVSKSIQSFSLSSSALTQLPVGYVFSFFVFLRLFNLPFSGSFSVFWFDFSIFFAIAFCFCLQNGVLFDFYAWSKVQLHSFFLVFFKWVSLRKKIQS